MDKGSKDSGNGVGVENVSRGGGGDGNPEIGKTAVSGDYFRRRDADIGWDGIVSEVGGSRGGDGSVSRLFLEMSGGV